MCIAIAVIIVFAVWDARVRRTDRPGFCPPDVSWTCVSRDFPSAWFGLLQSETWKNVQHASGSPMASWERDIRLAIGIRPTPSRWRLWLGDALLAASAPEGTGICAHPGILLRTAARCRSFFRRAGEDAVAQYGDYYYAWRDGFLIASTSHAYVTASLRAPEPALETPRLRDEIAFQWRQAPEGAILIRGANDIPVHGHIEIPWTARTTPMSLPNAWPERPILVVSAARAPDLLRFGSLAGRFVAGDERWEGACALAAAVVERWALPDLPEDWHAAIDHCSMALLDVDFRDPLPMPRLAFAMRPRGFVRAEHPLVAWAEALHPVRHEWAGQGGVVAPLWGQDLSLCLGRTAMDWLVTTQEPDMARLAAQFGPGSPVHADIAIRLDWEKLANITQSAITRMGDLGLVPGMDAREAAAAWANNIHAVESLGALFLEGVAIHDRLEFHGFLAKQAAKEPLP